MPHYVESDLGLHCFPITILRFPDNNGLKFPRVHGWDMQRL